MTQIDFTKNNWYSGISRGITIFKSLKIMGSYDKFTDNIDVSHYY